MQAAHISPNRLQVLRQFLADEAPEPQLDRQVRRVAELVGAASCSVMLLGSPGEGDACMSIQAHHGPLPDAALQAAIRRGEGISGRVLAKGSALLVDDIAHSEFAALARHGTALGASLMSAPIRVEGRVAGVINAANGSGTAPFDEAALCLLEVAAAFIGKSLQLSQLRHLLDSRFAQLALLQESGPDADGDRLSYRNPEDVARILARSLFREMTRAGFGSAHIVAAASELIGQLHQDIQQEKSKDKRLGL
ncbi:GAF domain-containing protein [Massilia agri]|uniref:GAF domain-containing protein n=1 Tax=Massilia agri TaxID=1886785 RepID=A0ABT2AH84_9BURK|nr:GAF domain-containing protein [Massilia agri]MCS0595599.1 GAF domain-containing protein [Massilia agri]